MSWNCPQQNLPTTAAQPSNTGDKSDSETCATCKQKIRRNNPRADCATCGNTRHLPCTGLNRRDKEAVCDKKRTWICCLTVPKTTSDSPQLNSTTTNTRTSTTPVAVAPAQPPHTQTPTMTLIQRSAHNHNHHYNTANTYHLTHHQTQETQPAATEETDQELTEINPVQPEGSPCADCRRSIRKGEKRVGVYRLQRQLPLQLHGHHQITIANPAIYL